MLRPNPYTEEYCTMPRPNPYPRDQYGAPVSPDFGYPVLTMADGPQGTNDHGPVMPTLYKHLGCQHQGHKDYGVWRVVVRQTGNAIGPQYKYRCELLADLDRIAEMYGY